MTQAVVVAHSKFESEELVTIQIDLHRFILAQVNTHRTFSRNYQSSRAMPIAKMLKQIWSNPALPTYLGTAKEGMVAGDKLTGWREYVGYGLIIGLSKINYGFVYLMEKLGISKEVANRYLEPWMMTRGVITATKSAWEEAIALRVEYDAQPEIQLLFMLIEEAIDCSTPTVLQEGEFHLPYVKGIPESQELYSRASYDSNSKDYIETQILSTEDQVKRSTAACAQVSYRNIDLSAGKTSRVYGMLNLPVKGVYREDKPHYSPAEHVAKAVKGEDKSKSGNFNTTKFEQYRKILELGQEQKWFSDQT